MLEERKRRLTSRLDALPFSRWHVLMICALGCTWVFDGYEVSMLGLVALQLQHYFNKSKTQIGAVASVYLAGCCTGAIIFGVLAYQFGRKRLFFVTLIVYAVSVIGAALMPEYYSFCVFRFLTGVGVGGEYTAIFAAVDEFIPPQHRGFADVVIDGTWHFGSFLASIMSIVVLSWWQDNYSWRVMFLLGALGTILIAYMRRHIPESPRWLLSKRKFRSAQVLIDYIEHQVRAGRIMSMRQYESEQSCAQPSELEDGTPGGIQNLNEQVEQDEQIYQESGIVLLKKICQIMFMVYPRRVFLGCVLMSCQAFFYQGIFYTFALNLNSFYGVAEKDVGYYQIPLSVASFTGPLILGRYFDSIGRRKMTLCTYGTVAVGLTIFAALFQTDSLSLVALIIVLTVIFVIASPGASIAHCVVSEIFPSEMRSQVLAVFFAIGLGTGGVVAPAIFAALIEDANRNKMAIGYYVAASLMAFAGVIGYFFGIDAERKPLEDISAFDVHDSQGVARAEKEQRDSANSDEIQNQELNL